MKTLKKQLKQELKDEKFKTLFEEEKELIEVSLRLQQARMSAGMSQKQLAEAAHLTQQQVSKVENGENCTIMTYLKAGHAIGLKMRLTETARKSTLHSRKK